MKRSVSAFYRFINTLLVFPLLLLSFSSCNKATDLNSGGKQNRIVSEDSPWFEGEIIDVDLGVDSERAVEDLNPAYIGSDDEYIYVFANGWYKVDWNKVKTNADYAIKNIIILDKASKQIYKTIDIFDVLGVTVWPEKASYFNGQLIVKCMCWDEDADCRVTKDFYIDPESEQIIETHVFERDNSLYLVDSFIISEYRIEVMCDQRSTNIFYTLMIYSTDGNTNDLVV